MRYTPLLLCLIFAAIIVVAETDVKTKPFLVVDKEVSESHVVVGSDLGITVTVTNYGQSPAFDIQLTDTSPMDGERKKQHEKLEFNESFELKYSIVPKNLGPLSLLPAQVSYLGQQGAETRLLATSNYVLEDVRNEEGQTQKGIVQIVSASEYERRHTKHIKEWLMYVFLAAVPVLFPYYMYKSKGNQVDQLRRDAKKRS